jgi:hypothetical protein
MTELKVECDCGQRYKFDVEPVNGRMPFTVNCPACGVDGTQKANVLLQQAEAVAEAFAAAPPIVPSPGPRLRVNLPAHSPSGSVPPPVAPPPSIGPLGAGLLRAGVAGPADPAKKPNFWMGILGAFLGALAGGAAYYFILTMFGLKSLFSLGMASLALLLFVWIGSSFLTLGVGYLAGAGGAFLGKGEGSKELGGIAAVFALAAVIGAQYLIALTWWHQARQFADDSVYSVSVDTAKEVVAAVPTGSDSEIRGYLAQQDSDDDDNVNSNSITAGQIKQFREEQLPEYQGLASGQITKAQFLAKNEKHRLGDAQDDGQKDENSDGGGTVKAIFLALLVRKTNILMLIAAAGLAYRTSANA